MLREKLYHMELAPSSSCELHISAVRRGHHSFSDSNERQKYFQRLKAYFQSQTATANSSKLLATREKLKSTLWICMPARQITAASEIKYQTLISKEWYYFLFFNHCVALPKVNLQEKLWRGSNINIALRKARLFYYRAVQQSTCNNMMHLIIKEQDVQEPSSMKSQQNNACLLNEFWRGSPRREDLQVIASLAHLHINPNVTLHPGPLEASSDASTDFIPSYKIHYCMCAS